MLFGVFVLDWLIFFVTQPIQNAKSAEAVGRPGSWEGSRPNGGGWFVSANHAGEPAARLRPG